MKRNAHKWLALLLIFALLATPTLAASGKVTKALDYLNIKITVNGEEITPTDVNGKSTEPFAIEGSTYVPVRAVSEALGCDVEWNGETATVEITAPAAIPAGVSSMTIAADGEVGITGESYNGLFGGDAAKAVAALIDDGAVKVNGIVVDGEFNLNGRKALWKNEDGTWGWNAQKLFNGDNLSYEDAVLAFVDGVTCLRGTEYELKIDDGKVVGIECLIYDAGMASTLTRTQDYTTFTGVGSVDEDAVDPSTVKFDNDKVEGDPQSQQLVLYWLANDGWHLKAATGNQVVVDVVTTPGENGGKASYKGTIDGQGITDSRLTLSYSESWNRPTQPIRAIGWMGDDSAEVYQWSSVPGVTIGFSRVDPKGDLADGIAKAEKALAEVAVSATGDGSDVELGQLWVTQDYHDIFTGAVRDAKAVLKNTESNASDYEGALYRLAQAYGGQTSDRFSWLDNKYFGKAEDESYDTGYNGTGFWTFAKKNYGTMGALAVIQENGATPITDASYDEYFKNGAAAGVEEILNAGKFIVNGFPLPAEEKEFNINLGFITLVKTDSGWSSSVHKGNTSDPTFEAARTKLAQGLTKFAGLYVYLYDDNADGYADRIETTVKQSVRVDELIVDGDTVKIDRTNFKVATKAGAGEINDVIFAAADVDPELKAGDVALYWEEPDGFHIERCASKVGKLTEGTDHGYYVFDGMYYEDIGGVTKYHMATANRPGQFLEAHRTLGLLGEVDIIAWTVGDYQIAGYSNVDSADILEKGVAAAKAANTMSNAALANEIAEAEAVLADSASTAADMDRQFYDLALAVDAVKK